MHPNAELITRFYNSLAKHDSAGMTACYASEVTFCDPVFTGLRGQEPGKMWRMLCKRGKDMRVVFDGIEATDTAGKTHWVATYTFSGTGNKVINDIQASFVFKDGKIVEHKDVFDLYKWAHQALGLKACAGAARDYRRPSAPGMGPDMAGRTGHRQGRLAPV